MNSTDPTLTAFATVARCARPVEQHLRALSDRLGARARPRVTLRPIDCFLLHQLAAMMPSPPDVIDLAADATAGASAVLWSSHPSVGRVRTPRLAADAPWRERFDDPAGSGDGGGDGAGAPVGSEGPVLVLPRDWNAPGATVGGTAAPVLAVIAGGGADEIASLLSGVFAEFPGATAVVAGVGRFGEAGACDALVDFRRAHPQFHVRLLRELCAFLGHSDLALVYGADDGAAPAALVRLAGLFEGNFEFLNLVNAVTEAAIGERGRAGGAASGNGAPAGRGAKAMASEQDYPRLVERVRAAVRDAVPAGASVLVVAKGDDGLLKIDGLRASHFPQTDKGTYAGHHPADDAAAVAHLEALRECGAEFLVLPATAMWWLEHYEGFRRYLETTASVTVCRPDTCILFALTGAAATTSAPGKKAGAPVPYPRLVEQVRQAVAKDVPPDATVAVVSKGDSQLIDLPGRRGVHFPQTGDGVYSGHHPADSAAAIGYAEAARGRGAEYLLFPATAFWWLEHYAGFRRYLEERFTRVRDDETCALFALGTPRRAGPRWRAAASTMLDAWARRLRDGGGSGGSGSR